MKPFRPFLPLFLALAAALPAAAQNPSQAPPADNPSSLFGEQIDVRVVNARWLSPTSRPTAWWGCAPALPLRSTARTCPSSTSPRCAAVRPRPGRGGEAPRCPACRPSLRAAGGDELPRLRRRFFSIGRARRGAALAQGRPPPARAGRPHGDRRLDGKAVTMLTRGPTRRAPGARHRGGDRPKALGLQRLAELRGFETRSAPPRTSAWCAARARPSRSARHRERSYAEHLGDR